MSSFQPSLVVELLRACHRDVRKLNSSPCIVYEPKVHHGERINLMNQEALLRSTHYDSSRGERNLSLDT